MVFYGFPRAPRDHSREARRESLSNFDFLNRCLALAIVAMGIVEGCRELPTLVFSVPRGESVKFDIIALAFAAYHGLSHMYMFF